MIPAWRRKIRAGERRTRPVGMPVVLSLGPNMKSRFIDEAEALGLHPNQLTTQVVESWLVSRKRRQAPLSPEQTVGVLKLR